MSESLEDILRTFLNANCQLLKLLAVHRADNDAVKRPLEDFEKSFQNLRGHSKSKQSIEICFDENVLSIMGVKIQQHYSVMESLSYIPEVFEVAMFESIAFDPGVEKSSVLEVYVKLAQHAALHSKPKALKVEAKGIQIVPLDPNKAANRARSKELLKDPEFALQHHYLLKLLVDRFFYGFASNSVISQKSIRRQLMELAQIARVAPVNVFALTLIDDHEGLSVGLGTAVQQSISTALLTMLVAQEMGMTTHDQIDLGLMGLLYNVGTLIGEAHALTFEKRSLSEAEYRKLVEAQASGIYRLLKAQGKSRPVLERLLSIFEQAQQKIGARIDLSLDAKLFKLTSQYIALTSARPYRSAYLPHEALKILGAELKTQPGNLDANLYFYLVRFLGIYPIGSYVELSNGMHAVVVKAQAEKQGYPLVNCFDPSCKSEKEVLDLSKSDIKILRALDPDEVGLAIPHYFL